MVQNKKIAEDRTNNNKKMGINNLLGNKRFHTRFTRPGHKRRKKKA